MAKTMSKKSSNEMEISDVRPDYLGDEVRGQENVGMEDLTIPRLDVLQSLSPQRKKNDPAYIEGAEEGMLFNTVTGQLYGESIYFVPVYYRKEWLIWKKQNKGGGFMGSFDTELEAATEFSEKGYDGDYEIVDTGNHFGLIFSDENDVEEICISMAKSKAKVSRQLNTLVKMAGGDRFSRVYKISATEDQNKEGQDYFNLKVAALGYAPEPLYRHGEKMYESISLSDRKVKYEEAPVTGNAADEVEEY